MDVPPFFGMWMNTGPGLVPSSESSISPRAGATSAGASSPRALATATTPRTATAPEVASAARRTRDARPDPSDRDDRGVAPSPLQADRARRGVRSPRSLIVRMARRGGARSASNTTAQRPPRPTPCSRAQGVIMRWHGAGECSCEILHAQPVTNFRGCIAAFEVRLDRGRVWDASRSGFNSRFQLQRGERTSRRPSDSRFAIFMRACTVRSERFVILFPSSGPYAPPPSLLHAALSLAAPDLSPLPSLTPRRRAHPSPRGPSSRRARTRRARARRARRNSRRRRTPRSLPALPRRPPRW